MDIPPSDRLADFHRIDWHRTVSKTYYEKRSYGHLLVNFNRIVIIHIAIYWFYTAYASASVYTVAGKRSPALTWSITALGGAVTTSIMIFASIAEFSYLPLTRTSVMHFTFRLLVLCAVLVVTGGPTVYVAIRETQSKGSSLSSTPEVVGIVQFVVSVIVTLFFAITPSGKVFGGFFGSNHSSAHRIFTASFPALEIEGRLASVALWVLVFGSKFVESYFFLTLAFRDSVATLTGIKVRGCHDRLFGSALCRNQVIFTLTIMYLADLLLFCLDTYFWYLIWSTFFSVGRSIWLSSSMQTLRKDSYSSIPSLLHTRFLVTRDTKAVCSDPKVRHLAYTPGFVPTNDLTTGSCRTIVERNYNLHVPGTHYLD